MVYYPNAQKVASSIPNTQKVGSSIRQKKYDERLPQAFFSSGGLELAIVKFGQEHVWGG